MEEHIAHYMRSLLSSGYSMHSLSAYASDLLEFSTHLTASSVNCFGYSPVEANLYVLTLAKKGLSATTIQRKLSALRGFYHYLDEQELISVNPFYGVKGPKIRETLPHYLSYAELMTILDGCCPDTFAGQRDRAIFEVLYSTGLRAQELVNLNLSESLNAELLLIKGKGQRERFIFFTPPAQKALALYAVKRALKAKEGEDALFINDRGGRLTRRGVYFIIQKYEDKLKHYNKLSVHIFRHTFATHLLDEGANLRVVQELLGHASLRTTQVYTHVSMDRLKVAYRAAHPHAKQEKYP
jgi:integrase/recombinase XerC